MSIAIIGRITTGAELIKKIKEVADMLIPDAPKELTDKFRWLQCTVKNETQFQVLLQETYFDSGRYWDAPGTFGQFSQLVYSCCNDDNAPTGLSGGTAFRLSLDDQHYFDFALGWTSPLLGSYKAGVVASSSAKDAYGSADDHGASLISKDIFEGKDKDGNTAKFRIHVSAAPSQKPLFVVVQVPVSE
ncbi:hypothetical protein BYT27DRAFT_7214790 [Phlegmacium glaucopus]|nr:hypothetical protein BYT27DRAFT_7214790 [Phlegmacium glaucopus]